MLDIAGLGSSPTKLLEALEKLGISRGADLRSPNGPEGKPDTELVRAFEDALNMPDEENLSAGKGTSDGIASEGMELPDDITVSDKRTVEASGRVEQADLSFAPEGPEVRGPVEPGPAEYIPGESLLRYERPEGRNMVSETRNTVSSDLLHGMDESVEGTGGMRRVGMKEPSSSADIPVEGKTLPEFSDAGGGENVREIARLLEEVTRGNASSMELYRLQYLVGMLQVHASSGMKVSQQAEQGLESLLKQQG